MQLEHASRPQKLCLLVAIVLANVFMMAVRYDPAEDQDVVLCQQINQARFRYGTVKR